MAGLEASPGHCVAGQSSSYAVERLQLPSLTTASPRRPLQPITVLTPEGTVDRNTEYGYFDHRSVDDEDVAVDLHGKKHVDTENQADRVYCLETADSSRIAKFPKKGAKSEREMREYLKHTVPSQLIRDAHGNATGIKEIGGRDLPKLQAKLWREWPKMAASISSFEADNITDSDMLVARAVMAVAKILEKNYCFILHNGSTPLCSLILCQKIHENFRLSYRPFTVTLEPLIDWATLDAVSDVNLFQNEVLLYRRNNRFLEGGLDLKKFIPKDTVSLCVECLHFLWDRRIKSRNVFDESLDSILSHSDPVFHSRQDIETKEPVTTSTQNYSNVTVKDESAPSAVDRVLLSRSQTAQDLEDPLASSSQTGRDFWNTVLTPPQDSFQTDGSCKSFTTPFKIWEDPPDDMLSNISKYTMRRSSSQAPTMSNFTTMPQTSISMNNADSRPTTNFSGWAAINTTQRPPLAKPASFEYPGTQPGVETNYLVEIEYMVMDQTVDHSFRGTFDMSEEEKYPNARAGFPIGPPQEYEYKPGITFPAPPMQDCGPIDTGGSRDREFGSEIQSTSSDNRLPSDRDELRSDVLRQSPGRSMAIFRAIHARHSRASHLRRFRGESEPDTSPTRSATASINQPEALSEQQLQAMGLFTSSFVPVNMLEHAHNSLNRLSAPRRLELLDSSVHESNARPKPPHPQSQPPRPQLQLLRLHTQPLRPHTQSLRPHTQTLRLQPLPLRPQPQPLCSQSASAKPKGRGASLSPVFAQPWPHTAPPPPSESPPTEKCSPSSPQVICSCHTQANTSSVKIVQCWNPGCSIGWFHYRCLNKGSKLSSLHGKWLCDACKGAKDWGLMEEREERMTDMSSAFSAQEIVNSMVLPGGSAPRQNPYGLGETPSDSAVVEVYREDAAAAGHQADMLSRQSAATPQACGVSPDAATQARPVHLGNLDDFGYAPSSPYWLTRAYSTDPAQFADEYIAQAWEEYPSDSEPYTADDSEYWS